MCGIAGIWHLNNSSLGTGKLQRFTDSLKHRGPDGSGYYIDENAKLGLGHRRLSILDLSDAGRQPMAFADGRYQLTFNGEIYNFIELRKELQKNGYTFKTESDTEVLITAFHCWGKACLSKFNGMWAFAIWDTLERVLFLARDRFGVKPLHYLFIPSELFAFASETIAFKYLDSYNRKINRQLLLRSIIDPEKMEPSGYTMFEDIHQLAAGCYIELRKNKPVIQQRWWNTFDHLKPAPSSFPEQVEQFKHLFEDACKIRLRADVPIASALSGGVDSSAVYCMINYLMEKSDSKQRIPDNWQKAFVATFPDTPQDERVFAEEVIRFTNGDATYIEPNYKNLANDIVTATLKFDSITGTPLTAVSDVYKSMKRNGITVSMDGHGADELMYGYRASVSEAYFDAVINNNSHREKDLLDTFTQMFVGEEQMAASARLVSRGKNIRNFENAIRQQNKLMKHAKTMIKNISTKNKLSFMNVLNTDAWFNNINVEVPNALLRNTIKFPLHSRSEARLASDFHIAHIPYNLRDFDRASMQNAIEIRMPFMDYRLVTFLFSLPASSKAGQGYTKLILREAMKGLMPENIRLRRLKIGLSAPTTQWFNSCLQEFVLDQVSSHFFLTSPYWNGQLIRQFAEERTRLKTWTNQDSIKFWNILNAHILLSNAN